VDDCDVSCSDDDFLRASSAEGLGLYDLLGLVATLGIG
jgi:hypothetical protein